MLWVSFNCNSPKNDDFRNGDNVHLALKDTVDSFDPVVSVDETSGIILNLLHRNLFTTDSSGKVIGDIASAVVPGVNMILIQIKQGIVFQDSSKTELTSTDVVFCLMRLKQSGRQSWIMEGISDIREYGRYGVLVTMNLPDMNAWQRQTFLLTLPQTAIYSAREFVEKKQFAGAARFQIIKTDQTGIELSAKGEKNLFFRYLPAESSRWFSFKRKKLDVYEAEGIYRFMDNKVRGYEKVVLDQPIVFYGAIVGKAGSILGKREFRQALNFRLDRENLVRKVLLEAYSPADYPVPDILGQNPGLFFRFDPEHDCGLGSGEIGEIVDIYTIADRERQLTAKVIQDVLAKCRVRSAVHVVDLPTLLKINNDQRNGIYLLKWIADYPHAENFLIPLFHSRSAGTAGNRSFYSRPEIDEMIDMGVRPGNIAQIQEMIRKDAPWIFIGFSKKTYYVNVEKKVQIPAIYTGWNESAFGLN